MKIAFERLKLLTNQLCETEVSSPETQAARTYAYGLCCELGSVKTEQEFERGLLNNLYLSMPTKTIEKAQNQLLAAQQYHLAEKWQKLMSNLQMRYQDQKRANRHFARHL
ncbi:hypothetical protein [Vibrio sp. WXL103]|uniref:hypothetical protein n=1 Tax=unclassified Vibrio TaxID=2614977 RepID=UPI003EC51F00